MSGITPKEFAVRVGSDPRTVRKFLRANAREIGGETPGKGSRWEIDAKKVKSLQTKFRKWNDARNEKPVETTETE
jgi:hypothetical protein